MMDPYEAYRLMREASDDSIERGEAALALWDWLARGGFWEPAVGGVSRYNALGEAKAIAQEAVMG